MDCKQLCSIHCRENNVCNHQTGHCENGCVYGRHGQYCNKTCIGNCEHNDTCNQGTGLCDSCADGWKGDNCDEGNAFIRKKVNKLHSLKMILSFNFYIIILVKIYTLNHILDKIA